MSSEQAVAFEGSRGVLRGMFHRPVEEGPFPTVIFLHGFTGNHIETFRLFVQMSRILTAKGFGVLRFDFYGSGDSDGSFDDFTVKSQLRDVQAAINWVSAQPGVDVSRLGLLGFSQGGCITALSAGRDPRIKTVVFWNAAANPNRYVQKVPTEGPLAGVYGGVRVGMEFIAEYHNLDVAAEFRPFKGPGLVVRGASDSVVAHEEADILMQTLAERGTFHLIEDANHIFQHPVWQQELFDVTSRWLVKHL